MKNSDEEGRLNLNVNFNLSRYEKMGSEFRTELMVKLTPQSKATVIEFEGRFNDEEHTFVLLESYNLGTIQKTESKEVVARVYTKDWKKIQVTNVSVEGDADATWKEISSTKESHSFGQYTLAATILLKVEIKDMATGAGKAEFTFHTSHPVYDKLFADADFFSN